METENKFDLRCPQCHASSCLDVAATVWVRLVENGSDADASHDGTHAWNDDSACHCDACGWTGTVRNATDPETLSYTKPPLINAASDQHAEPAPAVASKALINWALAAAPGTMVDINQIDRATEIQGELALPGDWFVEFDGQFGVLFRPVGSRRLCVVTRNDGMPAEIIELA